MASFETTCKYCDEDIEINNKYEGKWRPYLIDSDGEEPHNCREDLPYQTDCLYCDELITISKKVENGCLTKLRVIEFTDVGA